MAFTATVTLRSRYQGLRGSARSALGFLAAGLVLMVAWTILSSIFPSFLFPPIHGIVEALQKLAVKGVLLDASLATVKTVALGSALALVVGILAGFALQMRESVVKPIVNLFQIVPNIVWALLAVTWFGLTPFSVVFVVVAVGFPIIGFNTWEGLKNVDRELKEMALSVNAKRDMVIRHVVLPSLTPYLMGGVRVTVGFAWKASVLAELVTGNAGIGHSLFDSWEKPNTTEVFAYTLWLVVLMWASEYGLIRPVESYLTRWRVS
ncbi:MAG: ABC transporter permease subunit [Chloroflexi bacterium]|nr:ABC transporter permease subunit [Chloroflexota bacterium]